MRWRAQSSLQPLGRRDGKGQPLSGADRRRSGKAHRGVVWFAWKAFAYNAY
ncbi:hypothetical protein RSal33209_1520 [Renibacterium salmoninarum ATCC 33209]|uniref:Uncharacterized protein n=1 Tax=Renibacterium salmoninarum (strain ATCC 33209 / DSM 20767 / JCM 11484 / NBRC 15589 / NCIMB 2235) TaxID=288705 RepID=A9WNQ7_RENSM|nr:hypothetical protein RSal33209_1520 [Renibacterium salmoninarum ATCC 33209]